MLPTFHLITNREQATEAVGSLELAVRAALEAGCRFIQLRDKTLPRRELGALAADLVALAHQSGATILINTHIDLARQTGADGLHRPADGPSLAEIRSLLGAEAIIGVSTHSLAEAEHAQDEGADYITLSPIFETPSKPGYGPSLGLAELGRVCEAVDIPVYALAGVTPERVKPCLEAGAHGVAVMGGVMRATKPDEAVRDYLNVVAV
jgi:thiamine-phosphate pyrophosphorylase